MTEATIAFIGLGLIGGSIARGIKREHPNTTIMAYMRTRRKLEQARDQGIVDIMLDGIGEELGSCDLIFLCAPVEYNARYLSAIRPYITPKTIVTDVGSTKTDIHQEVIRLGLESCFIGGHPMAGSEKTGYEYSSDHLLENAFYIITPTKACPQKNIDRMVELTKSIKAIPIVLDYQEHDFITAAISHLPHIIASSLVNLVKECDNDQQLMKQLAAGGFKDITRIASASPEMWEQICISNNKNLAMVLERYIKSLSHILNQVQNNNPAALRCLFETSKAYRNSISDREKGSIVPEYFFSVDVVDEPGSISTLSVILASKGISIKNIGINHNREHGEGVLGIMFYDEEAMHAAWEQLSKYHYDLIKSQ